MVDGAMGAVDSFHILCKSFSTFAAGQMFQLAGKDSLPLGLGSGKVAGLVVCGLTHLLTFDARPSLCNVHIGLAVLFLRPNPLEWSILIIKLVKEENIPDPLLSDSGIM
jgi:hypothetical protein